MAEGVDLLLSARRARALSGEALPVDVVVRNDGEAPLTLRVGPTHPIVFELRVDPDGPVLHTRSRLMALKEAMSGRSKPLPPSRDEVVQPGASLSFAEDPAAGSATPIPAGRYLLTAHWEIEGDPIASDPVDIVVEPPAAGRLTSLFCPFTGGQAQAFDHHGEGVRLYQRDSGSHRADASVFWPRAEVAGVDDLVLAVHVAPRLAGRWLGWLNDGSLGALLGLKSSVPARPPLVPVELSDAVLVQPALQRAAARRPHTVFDWGEALFLVAGTHAGAAVVRAFVATGDAITPGPVAPLTGSVPARVLARWSTHTQTLQLVWAEAGGGGTRVLARRYSRELEPLSAEPEPLYDRSSPLAALELEPVDDGRTPGFVHALLGPEGDDTQARDLVYARIPLDDPSGIPQELFLPAPHLPVDAYAISGSTSGELLVLAKIGSEVCRIAAGGPSAWRTHIRGVPHLRSLRLAAARRYWAALALDPERGVLCVPDPDFSPER